MLGQSVIPTGRSLRPESFKQEDATLCVDSKSKSNPRYPDRIMEIFSVSHTAFEPCNAVFGFRQLLEKRDESFLLAACPVKADSC